MLNLIYKNMILSRYWNGDTDDSVITGHTYTYEIWKNMNGKRIQGSGSLSY